MARTNVPIASAVGTQQKGFIMEKVNILRVDIRDNEEFDGDSLLHSFYVLNPDMQKISQIRDMVESRLDDVDEEGNPSFESIGDIEAVLRQHFTLLKIPRAEIMW